MSPAWASNSAQKLLSKFTCLLLARLQAATMQTARRPPVTPAPSRLPSGAGSCWRQVRWLGGRAAEGFTVQQLYWLQRATGLG